MSSSFGSAERRVIGMTGAYAVCPGDWVPMNFARFEIDLHRRPNDSAKLGAGPMSTAQVKP